MVVQGQKNLQGKGRQTPPRPPACLRLKKKYLQKLIISRFRKRHFINSFDVLKNHELNCMVIENQGFPQISNLSSSSQKSEKSLL